MTENNNELITAVYLIEWTDKRDTSLVALDVENDVAAEDLIKFLTRRLKKIWRIKLLGVGAQLTSTRHTGHPGYRDNNLDAVQRAHERARR